MDNKYGLNFGYANVVDSKAENKNGFQANSKLIDPAYLGDGSTNLFLNNQNFDPIMVEKFISDVYLETLKSENDNKYLSFATQNLKIPAKSGTSKIQVQRWRTMTLNTAPMREAEVPKPLTISLEAVSLTTSSYGDWTQITDIMLEHNPVEVLGELTRQLAEVMRLKLNIIAREVLYLGATHAFVGETSNAAEAGKKGTRAITIDDFSMIIKQMKDDKVKPHSGGKYIVLGGVDLIMELSKDPTVKEYALAQSLQPIKLAPWDVKLIYGDLAVIEVTEPKKVQGDDADTEVAFVLGYNAYATCGISGLEGIKIIKQELGSAGTADPFNQMASLSAQIKSFGIGVINPNAIYAVHFPNIVNAVGAKASGAEGEALYNSSKIILKDGQTMHTLLGSQDQDMTSIWEGGIYPRPIESHKQFMEEMGAKEVFIKSPLDSLTDEEDDNGGTPPEGK